MTPFIAPTANPVFFRTYSRRFNEERESWEEVCDRTIKALVKLGCLTISEADLLMDQQSNLKCLSSGRWLWVGGTKWLENPNNFYGSYNCSSCRMTDWRSFRLLMDLAMMGTGTGAMLENRFIDYLPTISTQLDVKVIGEIGSVAPDKRRENTEFRIKGEYEDIHAVITVGDSRKGWVDSYHHLLELSSSDYGVKRLKVLVDVSNVRPSGEPLKGFGGTSNPSMLEGLYPKVANVLNKAIGRKLTAVDCCLIIDEAALVIVSGNIRRCLAYGSSVSTDKGRKAIQDIQIGDKVLTTKGYYPVTDKFDQGIQKVCRITTSGGHLHCTTNHQVALWNNGDYVMVRAGSLHTGDRLLRISDNGASAPDRVLSVEWDIKEVETFDLEVDEVHEFVCEGILVHNSAGMKQGSKDDPEFVNAKLGLWQQDEEGNWRIDPERDALRMSNHTQVFHTRPTEEECIAAVRQQYYSGEGAIQFAPEAVARANADLFPERKQQIKFIKALVEGRGDAYLRKVSPNMPERELKHRMERWGLNPCGEIVMADGLCNLSEIHLNNIDPFDFKAQEDAFKAGGIMVAALLHHKFPEERLAYSRELDPIVGVSFTGLFDFFVNAFGVDWLRWWEAGRPEDWGGVNSECIDRLKASGSPEIAFIAREFDYGGTFDKDGNLFKDVEKFYLIHWKKVVQETVWEYCDRHGLKRPNRYTTCQPAGCADRTALRIFDQGLLYADELVAPGSGETVGLNLSVRGGIGATTAIANQPLQLLDVELSSGRRLSLTPNHRLSVAGEWVRADELEAGMVLANQLGRYWQNFEFSAPPLLEKSNYSLGLSFYSSKAERIPISVRKSSPREILAFFAGLFDSTDSGNGSYSGGGKYSFCINGLSEESNRNIQQVAECVGLLFHLTHDYLGNSKLSLDYRQSLQGPIEYLNEHCLCLRESPILYGKGFIYNNPFEVVSVCLGKVDYSYDFAIEGKDDDDSWYWQGAIKSHNTKSLLTGASPGWHPPKAQRFIRRITFGKNDPVALACIDYGYSVIPSQSDKDENGNLLNDPFDPRCTEWLVEIPVSVNWADLPGADELDISKFSVLAQVDFAMQVQQHYVGHNLSSTWEMREDEIEPLGRRIYQAIQNDEGYISAALLARFDDKQTYPRLPFEPIDKATYERLSAEVLERRVTDDFKAALARYDKGDRDQAGPAGCDSDKCLLPEKPPQLLRDT